MDPEALAQTLDTAVLCALLCSQPGGGKTLLTSQEYRSESSLLEERVEHHISIPDGYYHVLIITECIITFGHVSRKKAMSPTWPSGEHFICKPVTFSGSGDHWWWWRDLFLYIFPCLFFSWSFLLHQAVVTASLKPCLTAGGVCLCLNLCIFVWLYFSDYKANEIKQKSIRVAGLEVH